MSNSRKLLARPERVTLVMDDGTRATLSRRNSVLALAARSRAERAGISFTDALAQLEAEASALSARLDGALSDG